jgi:error-prone DNA polymerase
VSLTAYAELHCISHFTFLRGASAPEELVRRAAELGYTALALTDECSVAGVVRAHQAALEYAIQLIIGSEFCLDDGLRLLLLPMNSRGYAGLCALITQARCAAPKGQYQLGREAFSADSTLDLRECQAIWLAEDEPDEADAAWFTQVFPGRVRLALELQAESDNQEKLSIYKLFSKQTSIPLVACGDVHMHVRGRRALQDTVTAIRLGLTLQQAGRRLQSNGERYLKSRQRLARLYPPELLIETLTLSAQLNFSLDQLEYRYPSELVPAGQSAERWLRQLTEQGKRWRWPDGVSAKIAQQIENELQLISELSYEAYFLTVHDIVQFARKQRILCQGRGSAANSAVCFCLGITEVDPTRINMLMERFISRERDEPPDIDVDFEHERREEVIQYIYRKYGRMRAALTASVITYKPRSAIRDVGKALGLSGLQTDRMARAMQWWDGKNISTERVREAGLDPDSPLIRRLLAIVQQLLGFPRHLSQHVGGFLVAEQPLTELVPIENATMPDRTVIQWDKNDLDDLGLLKIDVLGLGMLSAIHRCFDLLADWYGRYLSMASVPAEDPRVYRMISAADTVGVFQIESRAQMAMLPRLKPACYYDLVIEIALIRPGPIQGDMVHPYLRRRNGEEPVDYPSGAVRSVLERTLGVPIFQEQVMQLAIIAAGFSGGEADQLRRAMAAWKRRGGLEPFKEKLVDGMREHGYSLKFAEQIYRQIQGFGEYGFPESHAASFALLVYVSAWLKCHEPAVFACALLNSQPMGFYAPAQIIRVAREAGVRVSPVDVNHSDWDCTLEGRRGFAPELRLGLRMVKGLAQTGADQLLAARGADLFASIADLAERVKLSAADYAALAAADTFRGIAGNRHRSRWQVAGIESSPLFPVMRFTEGEPLLRVPRVAESVLDDYASAGLSLRQHPVALIRDRLGLDCQRANDLSELADGAMAYAAGLVITRQRPGSAAKVTFVTLEDETGFVNVVVWEQLAEQQRRVLLNASVLGVYGQIQKQDGVLHLIARNLEDCSQLLGQARFASRDFH